MFDTYDQNESHTSLLARGSVAGGVWWEDTTNRSHCMLSYIADSKFDFIRDNPRLTAILKPTDFILELLAVSLFLELIVFSFF